jgi:hypothetical protein
MSPKGAFATFGTGSVAAPPFMQPIRRSCIAVADHTMAFPARAKSGPGLPPANGSYRIQQVAGEETLP